MDEETRGNQRRRERQTNREANRRNENASELMINAGDDEQLPLSLSLGSTSYSSQIPSSMSSPRLAQSSPSLLPSFRPPPRPDYGIMASLFTPAPYQITPVRPAVRPLSNPGIRIGRQQPARNQNAEMIQPPYPWATTRRGVIQSLENLESKQITTITGEVECKHCDERYQVSYDLRERFAEVEYIFRTRIRLMRNRAPRMWTNPEPRRCELCGREKSVKPVIATRKCHINWLFLLLGQTLGFCTLEQLKNFCKHSKSHRTGAKDRVLYLTYLGLCKMLKPNEELFDRETDNRSR